MTKMGTPSKQFDMAGVGLVFDTVPFKPEHPI